MNELLDKLILLSKEAYDNDEIPVAAIIVDENRKIVGYGINDRNNNKSVFGHAELNAIDMACKNVGDWRLDKCTLFVTLLPCMMCAGAILESRIKKIYYICDKTNKCFNINNYISCERIMDEDAHDKYLQLLQLFFKNKRNKE